MEKPAQAHSWQELAGGCYSAAPEAVLREGKSQRLREDVGQVENQPEPQERPGRDRVVGSCCVQCSGLVNGTKPEVAGYAGTTGNTKGP